MLLVRKYIRRCRDPRAGPEPPRVPDGEWGGHIHRNPAGGSGRRTAGEGGVGWTGRWPQAQRGRVRTRLRGCTLPFCRLTHGALPGEPSREPAGKGGTDTPRVVQPPEHRAVGMARNRSRGAERCPVRTRETEVILTGSVLLETELFLKHNCLLAI